MHLAGYFLEYGGTYSCCQAFRKLSIGKTKFLIDCVPAKAFFSLQGPQLAQLKAESYMRKNKDSASPRSSERGPSLSGNIPTEVRSF
jgi:hypothetical protein